MLRDLPPCPHLPPPRTHTRATCFQPPNHAHRRTSSTSETLRAIVATGQEVAQKVAESKIHLLAEDDMTGKAEYTELYFDLIFVAAMFRLGNMVA